MILSGFGCNMLNAAVVIEQGQMLDQLILTGPGMALLEAAGQFGFEVNGNTIVVR